MDKILSEIESILFLSNDPVSTLELSKIYKLKEEEIKEKLLELKSMRKDTGINLKIENNIVYLVSNPLNGEIINVFFNPDIKIKKLSKGVIETLTIIAYKGPITKSEVEKIRGVGIEKSLSTLLDKNLIYISGKRNTIGTPNLYDITEDFFSYMSINSREDLPNYESFSGLEIKEENKKEDLKEDLSEEDIDLNNENK